MDYDLVVIGGNRAGVEAAIAATHYHARVALVEQENPVDQPDLHFEPAVGSVTQQAELAAQFGLISPEAALSWPDFQARALGWAARVGASLQASHSAAMLASLGIDLIAGKGQFHPKPRLGFTVNGRDLRARSYLIASGTQAIVPDIAGLAEIGYFTPPTFCQQIFQAQQPEDWPQEVLIVGGDPLGISLAQTLTRLGIQVTLAVGGKQILAREDPEAVALIQAQLEAEGVRILTRSRATQMRQIQARKWVQAGDFALEADAIILAAGQHIQVDGLNLEAVGVRCQADGPQLNAKLQTTNPRIYACRGAIAGYRTPQIARYEAELAVKNALFFPWYSANYQGIPWATFTHPELVRIGLTEPQAQERYGKNLTVLRQYFKTSDKAQILGLTAGFCKLLVDSRGRIVGVHLVGTAASELIGPLGLAVRQGLPVTAIAQLPSLSPTLAEVIQATAQGWQLSRQAAQRDWLEGYLNFRRTWWP